MSNVTAQVRIHNSILNKNGERVRKVLSIKAGDLFEYVDNIRKEANTKFEPDRSEKFDGWPLLAVVDSFDTGEEVIFPTKEDLPKDMVMNSKGQPILIIIPDDFNVKIGINIKVKDKEEKLKNIK